MSLDDANLNRLIESNLRDRKEMSPGMTICVSIIVVVVILILFGMLMKSPSGVRMIKTLKQNKRKSKRKSTKKLVSSKRRKMPPVKRKKMFRGKNNKVKRTNTLRRGPSNVNLTRRRIKTTTLDPNYSSSTTAVAPNSLPQYAINAPTSTFTSYNASSSTAPSTVPNMSTSSQSTSSANPNTLSASQIESGVAQATLSNSLVSSSISAVPQSNSFVNTWLYGDVSSSIQTAPAVRVQSVWEELAGQF